MYASLSMVTVWSQKPAEEREKGEEASKREGKWEPLIRNIRLIHIYTSGLNIKSISLNCVFGWCVLIISMGSLICMTLLSSWWICSD